MLEVIVLLPVLIVRRTALELELRLRAVAWCVGLPSIVRCFCEI
jgi:hypothetical protein